MNDEILEIPTTSIEYQIQDGYVRHWLVAGPLAVPVPDLDRYPGADFKEQIARAYYTGELEITQPPAERAAVDLPAGAGSAEKRLWAVVHCDDDRFVDVSRFHHTCHHLRTWAYCQLLAPARREVHFTLTTNGPADVWINGQHVHRHLHFHHQIPHSGCFSTTLDEGRNEIMVRFEAVAVRECPYVMALQVTDQALAGWPVILPTTVEPVARRQKLEDAMAHAYLEKSVYHRDEQLKLFWARDMAYRGKLTVRLQTPSGRIYADGQPQVEAGAVTNLGAVYQVPSGEYQIVLMPLPEEYYVHDMRVQRKLPLRIANDHYAELPTGAYDQRRREALENAAGRSLNVFSEIAKMELERWSEVKPEAILQAVDGINRRADCSDFYLVGLLGMMARFMDDPGFPDALRQPLEECVLNFRYWMDEPGDDAMCFWSENHQILFHACAVLAGQLYPERIFSNTGELGRWHRVKGERMALSWLHKRGQGGFREWDSNCYFEEDVLALAHLADLADDSEVAEMAAVILDKLFFTMAVNSFRGTFGSTHGRTYAPYILSGRLEPTSGLGRLAFGMGSYNDRILGTVSLACATGYELPPLIAAIAADKPAELWSRERHAGVLEEWCDRAAGEWEVNKVTYKTPDFMLSSVQDFQAGCAGYQQHIWQATLGPSAVVFVNHPPCVSEEGSHRPNVWHGNVTLPRVAQWKDVLVAVHNFAADDWMGFTHAYFPAAEFDEAELRNGWAFARKGDGYLALTAARGIQQTTRGPHAYRELRSYGHENVWLCHLGRAMQDGSFAEFQARTLALPVHFDGLRVQAETLRGQRIAFGWDEAFLVDGEEQALGGFKHYESAYCEADLPSQQMEIRYLDQAMRLNFSGA